MSRIRSLTSMLAVTCALAGLGCGGTLMEPSGMGLIAQGNVALQAGSFAAVPVQVNRSGTLTSIVNWNDFFNDIDTWLLRGTCMPAQVAADEVGCRRQDTLAVDDSQRRPSVLTASVTPGAHTLVLFHFGSITDIVTYSIEVN